MGENRLVTRFIKTYKMCCVDFVQIPVLDIFWLSVRHFLSSFSLSRCFHSIYSNQFIEDSSCFLQVVFVFLPYFCRCKNSCWWQIFITLAHEFWPLRALYGFYVQLDQEWYSRHLKDNLTLYSRVVTTHYNCGHHKIISEFDYCIVSLFQ